jgi:hypothetical protein
MHAEVELEDPAQEFIETPLGDGDREKPNDESDKGSDYTDYGTELVLAVRENNIDEQANLKEKIAIKLHEHKDLTLIQYGMLFDLQKRKDHASNGMLSRDDLGLSTQTT